MPQLALASWFKTTADWPDAVLPEYAGGSIANLPASILSAFDARLDLPGPAVLEPLDRQVLHPSLLSGARIVVMLVIDGLGSEALSWAREQGALEYLSSARHSSTITSVFPSTTAAALTTLQTGLSPAQHGMAGYTMYLEQQHATVNMITWKPAGGVQMSARLPEPKGFLGVPTLFERLQVAGVESTVVSNLAFIDSALTKVHSAGVPYSGHRTQAELAGLLLAEVRKPGRRFVFGYWDGFDALAHTHGPQSDICLNEVFLLDRALGRGFLEQLASEGGDVAVLLVSDHGHTRIEPERVHSLKSVLGRYSTHRPIPTGDRRAAGLAFDEPDALLRLASIAGTDGAILAVPEALANGLYGPGEPHANIHERIGKTLLLARGNAAFVYPQSNNPTLGGHGSLTSEEMLVPLLGWRF